MFNKLYSLYKNYRKRLCQKLKYGREKRRLKNNEFSIISNACFGGFIYHNLSKEFLSPTINLWIGADYDDFMKFLLNMDHYLNCELKFFKGPDEKKYPRAYLDDILIGFNHYETEDEAKSAWERRKKRILKDRIYVIYWNPRGIKKEQYDKLTAMNFRNVAVISYEDTVKDFSTCRIKRQDSSYEWFSKDRNGIRLYEKYFDYVEFLNTNS